jgi:hypothetical protein
MLSEAFEWMKRAIVARKAETMDELAGRNVTWMQIPDNDGGVEVVPMVTKAPVRLTVNDTDSFVVAVTAQYAQRYGSEPYEGPQEDGKTPVVNHVMPVVVMVSPDAVVARLYPSDACREKASELIQTGCAVFDEIRLPLTSSIAWMRLLAYSANSRIKQADIVREWEDVWQECTYHRLADKFRRIEIATRTEVTTGPRRDAGLQEFETKASDELPEKVELAVQRWVEYRVGDSSRCKVQARIVLERTTPPTVGIVPVVGSMELASIDAVGTLKRELEFELRDIKATVVVGTFRTMKDDE